MNKGLSDRVMEHVRNQHELLISLLRDLVMAESPSSDPAVHEHSRHVFMSALIELGWFVREVGLPDGPRHVYARPALRQRDSRNQLVVGHYDTVWPVGTTNDRPFTVDGNIIRGPGVFDMKGGLVQLILAIKTMQELGLEPEITPIIFVNADEEIGSRSSTRFIRALAKLSERAFVLEPALGEQGSIKTERRV